MKKYFALILSLLSCLAPTCVCLAQQCRETLPDNGDPKRFIPLNNGRVLDSATDLVWMRCSIGQSWNRDHNRCEGSPTPLSWYQAKRKAAQVARQLDAAWRLPSIQELSSITELRCVNPAIDLHWFPNTPASYYWTLTPFITQDQYFWLVQFLSGENDTDSAKRTAFVRLVKPAEK